MILVSRPKGVLTPEKFREFSAQQMVIRVLIDQHVSEDSGLITKIKLVLFRAVKDKFFFGLQYEYEYPSAANFFMQGHIKDVSPSRISWEEKIFSDEDPETLAALSEYDRLERLIEWWTKVIPPWAEATPHVACLRQGWVDEYQGVAMSDVRLFEAYGRLQTALAYEMRLGGVRVPNRTLEAINSDDRYGPEAAVGNFNPWTMALHAGLEGFIAQQRRQLVRSGINI
jgi:hypothetical protein